MCVLSLSHSLKKYTHTLQCTCGNTLYLHIYMYTLTATFWPPAYNTVTPSLITLTHSHPHTPSHIGYLPVPPQQSEPSLCSHSPPPR